MTISGTTQLLHVPDWPERTANRLRTPWRGEANGALLAALGEGAQLHEDIAFDLVAGTTLDGSTGDALDKWGELVGEPRLGLSDSEYRPFIKARMLVNRCDGTTDALLELLAVAAGPDATAYHTTTAPGAVFTVARSSFLSAASRRRVARLMLSAAPAGRPIVVVEALSGGFGWTDTPDFATSGYSRGPMARLILDGF